MTVDEIFSSESEHLYFRLIAARNALNAAKDPETVQVLNEILDETLNNISRIGTDEEIAAAEEIVVRKSNKTVKEYLSSKKYSLIATAVMVAVAVFAALALVIIILGSNSEFKDKIKPIIAVALIAGFLIAASVFISSFMKKKMAAARDALKGKTVIGCKIDTDTGSASKASGKSEKASKADKSRSPKVVRNYFGIIKVVIIIGIIAVLGFLAYDKREDIVDGAKILMNKIGLYNPGDSYEINRWKEINDKLVSVKNGVYYNEAGRLFDTEDYAGAIALYEKCIGYQEADTKLAESRNYEYYTQAEKDIETDMLKARNDLKNITLPFKNTEVLLKEYNKHINYIASYGNGVDRFNLQNFSKKKGRLYILEERLGWVKVEGECDREGYTYKIIEKKSDEDYIYWYIASDNVLKATPEGDVIIKK
ncbi:MAG: hypothetical protein IKP88_14350 [Lachnospiraceae bacterium]|nr:hypothetical protein [Lachnospiraceae bacterium]